MHAVLTDMVGRVAGDEEWHEVELHNGCSKNDNHVTDLDTRKIRGGVFDKKYVLSSRVRTGRIIKNHFLPSTIHDQSRAS